MRYATPLEGTMKQGRFPDWSSLEELLDVELCAHFMWMFEVELEDGSRLDAYKHRLTRQYLHLAEDGRAFLFVGKHRYLEVDPYTTILEVFQGRGAHFSDEEEQILRATLNAARARLGRRCRGRKPRRSGSTGAGG